ncbi:MAG: tetratricopeptide repeat protein [Planctomycetota bacterium]
MFGKTEGSNSSGAFKRSDRKAEAFFRHAETTADARNYDYCVELYISGLRHQPDNLRRHEELREVAMRRKLAKGKKPGLMGVKSVGPSQVDKMLTAEKAASLDPTNYSLYVKFMDEAAAAEAEEPELHLGEVAYRAGLIAMEMMGPVKNAKVWIKLRDNFHAIHQYDKAIECCRRAVSLKPNDSSLLGDLKDLEAEKYAAKSSEKSEEGDGFRGNIKGSEEQELQRAAQATTSSGDALDRLITARRSELEENPEDPDLVTKLVDALLKKEQAEPEKEAIALLKRTAEQSGQYRFKVRAGDVAMRQFNRVIRQLRAKLKKSPDDTLKQQLQQVMGQKLKFELKEYGDRVDHYPTDLTLKFELGKRQFMARQYDDAIGSFQQAKDDPKNKAQAHYYLGKAYLEKGWSDEAIETLDDGIKLHPATSDPLAKEMRYDKMIACVGVAESNQKTEMAEEAERLASELLKTDINYKDIRAQRDRIRELVQKLKDG